MWWYGQENLIGWKIYDFPFLYSSIGCMFVESRTISIDIDTDHLVSGCRENSEQRNWDVNICGACVWVCVLCSFLHHIYQIHIKLKTHAHLPTNRTKSCKLACIAQKTDVAISYIATAMMTNQEWLVCVHRCMRCCGKRQKQKKNTSKSIACWIVSI